jgi:peroxiredoxin
MSATENVMQLHGRDRSRKLIVAVLAVLISLFTMVGSASAQKKHDWSAETAKGQKIKTKNFRGKVMMVIINHPEMRDEMKPITKALAFKYGHNPEVAIPVTIVDLRELEFYKRPFVNDRISKAQDRTVKRISKMLKDENKPPIPGLARKLHMIADFDGEIINRYNTWNTKKAVTLVVINKQGDIIGSFKGSQIEKAFEAVDAALVE